MTMNIDGRPLTAPRRHVFDTRLPRVIGQDAYRVYIKRVFDILLVLAAAPVVLPLVVFLAAIVALSGGAPFYTQTRIGYAGREFRLWKLRTMVADADARLNDHLARDPAARAEWARDQKLRHDPRITWVGTLLRKTSLDELPQLWNVLMGHMSLVGPRPMMVAQQSLYPGQAYYNLRPGITGPWQVSDRNETTFAARAAFDQHYERKVSFFDDLRILVETVGVVVRATGR
ncbi:MAG: sugar transferase [Pseudomonadota bacterium]